VGSDLQDLYGVRPATVTDATRLQDAYFSGGTARQLMSVLARQPDAILVSEETVRDFQLNPGDLLRLRLQDGRTGKLVTVPFHYAGIAREFPTAPRDSFFVANASYVAARTGNPSVGEFLVNTDGTAPPVVGARLRAALGPAAGITDIVTSRRVIASTLTAVDLSGLTKVELSFALALAISATALLLTLGFVERRRTFALARVLGAHPRQLGGFVWSEVLVTGAVGAVLGATSRLGAVADAGEGAHRGVRPAARASVGALGLPRRGRRDRHPRPGARRAGHHPGRPPSAAYRPARALACPCGPAHIGFT